MTRPVSVVSEEGSHHIDGSGISGVLEALRVLLYQQVPQGTQSTTARTPANKTVTMNSC